LKLRIPKHLLQDHSCSACVCSVNK
jgi:hypothetical protein